MNPKITITVSGNKASVATQGMVTVGSKVEVEINGITESNVPTWGSDDDYVGRSLRIRITDGAGRDVARFPLNKKDTTVSPQDDGDKWTVSNDVFTTNNGTDSTPVLELDTDVLRKAFRGVQYNDYREFGIIIDSELDDAQYAIGKTKILQWTKAPTEDPTVLPDWRETLADLKTALASIDSSKSSAELAAQSAASSSSAAAASAQVASSCATTADTRATAAAGSATQAEASKTSAVSAKDAAVEAKESAEEAAGHYPYIGTNGNWFVWDVNGEEFVDTGYAARGSTGAAAGFGTINATVQTLTPGSSATVDIVPSGPDTAKNFDFLFGIPRGADGEVDAVLEGETMVENPSQRQIAVALKKVWQALGGTIVMIMMSFCVLADIGTSTEWQDVPPATTIGDLLDLCAPADRITNSTSVVTADGEILTRNGDSRWNTNDILTANIVNFTNNSEFAQHMRMDVYPTRTVNPNWRSYSSAAGELGTIVEYYENGSSYKWGVDYASKAAYAKESSCANNTYSIMTSGGYGPYPWSLKFSESVFTDCKGQLIAMANDPITGDLRTVLTNAWLNDIENCVHNGTTNKLVISDGRGECFYFNTRNTYEVNGSPFTHLNGMSLNSENGDTAFNIFYHDTDIGHFVSGAFGIYPNSLFFGFATNSSWYSSILIPDGSPIVTTNMLAKLDVRMKDNVVVYTNGTLKTYDGSTSIATMDYPAMTNTVNEVKAQFYDSQLQVNWTMRMVNGEMKLYATTNVDMSTLPRYTSWSTDNLPSGVTWAAQPTYDASIDLWYWAYNGGTAQSEEGGANATTLTFGYGTGFTTTRSVIP